MTSTLPRMGTHDGPDDGRTPGERADRAVADILSSLDTAPGRGVVVDSPPGAGKSTLVVRAAGHLTSACHQLMIVAQTNEQVDDLVDRLAREHPRLAIGRLHAGSHTLPPRVTRHPHITGSTQAADLRELPVVVSTAKKWSYVTPDKCRPWRWAIVDEAYQMRSDALLATAPLFSEDDSQVLFVGDPGQLDPFATVETDRWHGLTWDPLRNAVDVTLAHTPDLVRHQLPVSWRLPETAAPSSSRPSTPSTGSSPVRRHRTASCRTPAFPTAPPRWTTS